MLFALCALSHVRFVFHDRYDRYVGRKKDEMGEGFFIFFLFRYLCHISMSSEMERNDEVNSIIVENSDWKMIKYIRRKGKSE